MSLRLKILALPGRATTPTGTSTARAGSRELERGPGQEEVREWSEVGGREIRMGRHPENELELPYAGISAFHAKLVKAAAGDGWELEDLGSSNGTWVAGVRLRTGTRHRLHDGETFRLGTLVLELDRVAVGEPTGGRLESTATMGRRLIVDGLVPENNPPPRVAAPSPPRVEIAGELAAPRLARATPRRLAQATPLPPTRSPGPSHSARRTAVIVFAVGTTVLAVSGLIALALSLR